MLNSNHCSSNVIKVALALAVAAAFGKPMGGQTVGVGNSHLNGLPDDWSHHHLVFTNPGTEERAIQNGTHEQWLRIVNDPRYVVQQLKKGLPAKGPSSADVAFRNSQSTEIARSNAVIFETKKAAGSKKSKIDKDWSYSLAASTTTAAMAPNAYPATFSYFPDAASCSHDYAVFPTGLAGSSTQATIIGFTNIYATTCSGLVPSNAFAYNTGGTAIQSPVISIEGTQVAYVQTVGTSAQLVLLTPSTASGGTIGTPASATAVTNANYFGCTAPCYTTIAFSGGANSTNSAPFYVYGGTNGDTIFVGDNNGKIHKFTNVFLGTPAEATTGGWPVTLTAGATTTSAVYDPTSTLLFVGDSGGYLYSVTTTGATTQTVIKSAHLTTTGSTGIVDAPLIDSQPATPKVYAFLADDAAGAASVQQFPTNFGAGAVATASETVSSGSGTSATAKLYSGAFDNIHYSIASGTAGNLYVCGFHSAGAQARLYQIAMNPTFTGTVSNATTDPSGATSSCSPVTEFLGAKANTTLTAAMATTGNPAVASATGIAVNDYLQVDSEIMKVTAITPTLTVTRAQLGTAAAAHVTADAVQDIQDWVFLSVTAGGQATGCTGPCLYNYSVTTGTVPANATAGITATGGTSGISVDNSLTGAGESQIYYTTLGAASCAGNTSTGNGTHGCAVQASQSAP